MKCPFCSYELEAENDICSSCKIDTSSYSYYQKRALELIDLAKKKFEQRSIAIELLKHSLILDGKNTLPLKLLGLLYTSAGRYDLARHYLGEYSKKTGGDPEARELADLLYDWQRDLGRYLRVTF